MEKILEKVTKEKVELVKKIFNDFKHKTLVHKKTISEIDEDFQQKFSTLDEVFPTELNYLKGDLNLTYCYETKIDINGLASIKIIQVNSDDSKLLNFAKTRIKDKNTYYVFIPFNYKDFILIHEISHIVDFYYSKFYNFDDYVSSFHRSLFSVEILANILSIGSYHDVDDGIINYIRAGVESKLPDDYYDTVFMFILNNLDIIKKYFIEMNN